MSLHNLNYILLKKNYNYIFNTEINSTHATYTIQLTNQILGFSPRANYTLLLLLLLLLRIRAYSAKHWFSDRTKIPRIIRTGSV
jgi:hypothetical protein